MRFINAMTFEELVPHYAVLSHTCGIEEISFKVTADLEGHGVRRALLNYHMIVGKH
jgi:hypothetical protein